MSEQNKPIELSELELDTVAGGALKKTAGETEQRTEVVFGSFQIKKGEITSTSFVSDDQFDADFEELIATGNSDPSLLEG